MNDFIPEYLHGKFSIFRVAKILGMSVAEAAWLDEAEIYRACCFASAEGMATSKSYYLNKPQ